MSGGGTTTTEQQAAEAAAAVAALAAAAYKLSQAIPVAGAPATWVIKGAQAAWDDGWSWVTSTVGSILGDVAKVASITVAEVEKIAATYAGQATAMLSGVINDVFSYAEVGLNAINIVESSAVSVLFDSVIGIDGELNLLKDDIMGIDTLDIPALLDAIGNVGIDAERNLIDGIAGVESWGIDTIYDPLQADIVRTAGDLYDAIAGAIGGVDAGIVRTAADLYDAIAKSLQDAADWAQGLVNNEALARIAALAGLDFLVGALSTAITATESWINDCGEPMCEVMGPKTDLGKFLKALNLVENAALLAYLASLDGAGIEQLLSNLVSLSGNAIDDISGLFTSGETVGSLLAKVSV